MFLAIFALGNLALSHNVFQLYVNDLLYEGNFCEKLFLEKENAANPKTPPRSVMNYLPIAIVIMLISSSLPFSALRAACAIRSESC